MPSMLGPSRRSTLFILPSPTNCTSDGQQVAFARAEIDVTTPGRVGLRVQDLYDMKIFRQKLDVVLKEKNATAKMMWWQNGKLWNSRLDAQEAMRASGLLVAAMSRTSTVIDVPLPTGSKRCSSRARNTFD